MNYVKRTLLLLIAAILTGVLLLNACSKDAGGDGEPDPIIGMASASATVEFLDTGEKVEFSGTASGAFGSGSADTVVLNFAGTNSPMRFFLMLTPVRKGKLVMGSNDFETHGAFFPRFF